MPSKVAFLNEGIVASLVRALVGSWLVSAARLVTPVNAAEPHHTAEYAAPVL